MVFHSQCRCRSDPCALSVSNDRFDDSTPPPYDASQFGSQFTLSTAEQATSAVDALIAPFVSSECGSAALKTSQDTSLSRPHIVLDKDCEKVDVSCQTSTCSFCHLLTLDLETSSPDATSQDTLLSRPLIVPDKDCEKVDVSCQTNTCSFCHLLTLDLETSNPDATSQDTSLSRPRIDLDKDCEKVDVSCQISTSLFSSFTYFRLSNIQS